MRLFLSFLTLFFIVSCATSKNNAAEKRHLKELLKSPDTVLVDVRIPGQFSEKTAENAINIPLAEIENNLEFFRNKQTVLFCNTGNQSGKALELLKNNGIANVYSAKTLETVRKIQRKNK